MKTRCKINAPLKTPTEIDSKAVSEDGKLSVPECRKVLNKGGVAYTDEQIKQIRDWLYHFTNTAIHFIENNPNFPEIAAKNKL